MLKEVTLSDYLKTLSLNQRLAFASIFSGVAATFGGLLPVNLFGVWTLNWLHWKTNLILLLLWSGITYFGIRFRFGILLVLIPVLLSVAVFVPLGLSSNVGIWSETWMIWVYEFTSVAIVTIFALYFRRQFSKGS